MICYEERGELILLTNKYKQIARLPLTQEQRKRINELEED